MASRSSRLWTRLGSPLTPPAGVPAGARPAPVCPPSLASLLASSLTSCSLAPALLHQPDEALEQVVGVVGARRRFGVVLHAEDRQAVMLHPLDGLVVEVDVGEDRLAMKRVDVDGEALVLRR